MKKLLMLSIATITSSLFTLKAQGTWTPRASLPNDSAMEQGIPGFSINGYGYVGLGNYTDANILFDDLWQFDPSNNSWTRKTSFPGKVRVAPACFVIGDKAYLVTGSLYNSGPCVTECWEYDATTNIWTKKANFPGAARTYAVGFAINGIGYVGTGANELSDFYKDFYSYNPLTNKWSRIADFGGIARDGDCGFAVNGKGYVCFGQDSTIKNHNDMWEYDTGTNTWTQKTSNPSPMLSPSGFAICNNIYVGSGDSTAGFDIYFRQFWKYNTVEDTWSLVAFVPGVKRIQGAAFAIADTGYYGFGADSFRFQVCNVFDKFYDSDNCLLNEGIKKPTYNKEIKIYPNPFDDECSIEFSSSLNEVPIISLYNIEGIKQSLDVSGINSLYIIKRNGLLEGVYVLVIAYKDQIYYKKLVIIN